MTDKSTEADLLCAGWAWDAVMRELKHYPRRGRKGYAPEPDAVEQLAPAKSLTVHLWSQQPMQTSTGEMMSSRQARILLKYEDGRELEINEADRDCVEKLVATLAGATGLAPERLGAPGGRTGGNLPVRDEMGRLSCRRGKVETMLDEAGGILTITRKGRLFGKKRLELRTTEIRALELDLQVVDANEVFIVNAVLYPEDERVPVASYAGLEGWAEPEEWREFTRDLARSLGVEARVDGADLE